MIKEEVKKMNTLTCKWLYIKYEVLYSILKGHGPEAAKMRLKAFNTAGVITIALLQIIKIVNG